MTECLFGGDLSVCVFCRRGAARSSRVGVGECGMFVKSWNTPTPVDLERTEGGWGREEGGNGFGDSGGGGGGNEFCAIPNQCSLQSQRRHGSWGRRFLFYICC